MENLIKNNKNRQVIQAIFLGLIIIWMITVFMFSNQQGEESSGISSNVATKITEILSDLNIINIEQKTEIIEILNPIVRKLAHYFIYAIGGILIINYINTYKLEEHKKMIYSVAIGAIYATLDELHQLFINGRNAQISDVVLDTIGVATGVCIFLCIVKIIQKIKVRAKR